MQRNRKNLLATGTLAALAASAALVHPGHAQDTPLTADLAEVYRAGGLDVPEWAQFTAPGQLGFDGSGNLHVLDNAAHRVVVIGPDGQLVRTVGRQGEGPGELNDPINLVVWRDGTFAVEDEGHFAFQVFGPDGTLARFVRLVEDGNPMAVLQRIGMASLPARPDPRGGALFRQGRPPWLDRILLSGFDERLGGIETEEAPVDDRGIERVEVTGETIVVRAVLRGWRAPREEAPAEISANDVGDPFAALAMIVSEGMHFEPRLHWDILPDGTIAYSDSSAYAVKMLASDGSLTGVLGRPYEPEAVDRRLRARVLEAAMERVGPVTDPDLREALENVEVYPEVPVILGIRATWEGSLWIKRRGEDPLEEEGPIDVFGTDRRYLGTFAAGTTEVPGAFGPDGLVAFWEIDELGIPTVVVKRLPEELR